MSDQQQEAWGGEVQMPRWLRRVLRRPEPLGPTEEAAHEARKSRSGPSVFENANRASVGAMADLYREGRTKRRS
jgi:hypothetical protein